MKSAFSMIELIFVIVIIGLLAGIAIPRLTATRDDAKISTIMANTKICLNDAISAYKGLGIVPDLSIIPACVNVNRKIPGAVSVSGDNIVVSGVDATVDGNYIYKGTRVDYRN